MSDPRDDLYRAKEQAELAYQVALRIQEKVRAVAEATDFLVDYRRTRFDRAVTAWGDAKIAAAFRQAETRPEAQS